MKDGYVKMDEYASIFITAAYLLGDYLGSVIHCLRRSSWESETADNLMRRRTTSFLEQQILIRYAQLALQWVIEDWMQNPSNNWILATVLLKHVMSITKCE
jgi:hypothetical protein